MKDDNKIIFEREPLKLNEGYSDIRSKFSKYLDKERFCNYLETKATWSDKSKVYMLDDTSESLRYKTEQILPPTNTSRIPVMLLFSNPHPTSVSNGLFFSESHSRCFWTRLFDCKTIFPKGFASYNSGIWKKPDEIRSLSEILTTGKYESKFILYFYCYWSLPTRDAAGLKSIFNNHDALWNKICKESQDEFKKILNEYKINNVIVFADAPFKQIANISEFYKYEVWLDGVKEHLNRQGNGNNERAFLKKIQWTLKDDNNVKVYRSLITKDKNLKIGKTEGRYFTELLDGIFKNISGIP